MIKMFKTFEVAAKRAPSEIFDDDVMTEAEENGTAHSPCRYTNRVFDEARSTFRTTDENEDELAQEREAEERQEAEFRYDFLTRYTNDDSYKPRKSGLFQTVRTPETPLLTTDDVEAVRGMMRETDSGPPSPSYDPWNAKTFETGLHSLSTARPWKTKSKKFWGPCESSCHWCSNPGDVFTDDTEVFEVIVID